jgi:uncharacterized protein (DUF433 family)
MARLPTPLVSARTEYLSGALAFHGTRVHVQTLFDYLAAGDPLEEFLIDFPSVSREHALAVIKLASQRLLDTEIDKAA